MMGDHKEGNRQGYRIQLGEGARWQAWGASGGTPEHFALAAASDMKQSKATFLGRGFWFERQCHAPSDSRAQHNRSYQGCPLLALC